MTEDAPEYSRNSERRQVVVMVVCAFSFFVTLATTAGGMKNLIGGRTQLEPGAEACLIVFTALLSGFLVTALAGVFVTLVHRRHWPERSDDE